MVIEASLASLPWLFWHVGLLCNVPPHNGHNVFSAWVPLNLDLLGQLKLDFQHCSGQMSHNHPPERVSIRTELRRWQKLSPGATMCLAYSYLERWSCGKARSKAWSENIFALHMCTCSHNENQGYFGLLLSLRIAFCYDTECGLREEECLNTSPKARNQDILGQDQMKSSPLGNLMKPHLQRSSCLAATPGPLLSFQPENFNT